MFSILMANFNRAAYLVESIKSVQNQTIQNWEIIFVDDCSTDHSWALVKQIAAAEPRLKIFRHRQNQGCGATKNDCFKKATGNLAAYLDPDDLLAPEALAVMIAAHQKHRSASLIYSQFSVFSDANSHPTGSNPADSAQPTHVHRAPAPHQTYLTDQPYIVGHLATFKTQALRQAHGLNPALRRAVDQDLYYRLEEQGPIFFIDQQLYFYRLHDQGLSTGNNGRNRAKAFYWHLQAAQEACLRRGLDPETILAALITAENKAVYLDRIQSDRFGRLFYKLSLLPRP